MIPNAAAAWIFSASFLQIVMDDPLYFSWHLLAAKVPPMKTRISKIPSPASSTIGKADKAASTLERKKSINSIENTKIEEIQKKEEKKRL